VHNGMVELDREKMAKSVGNITLLHGALDEFGRDALVMYLVAGHYRRPLTFSSEALDDARRAVKRLRDFGLRLDRDAPAPDAMDAYAERFFDALADDFNTPTARAVLFEWVAEGNRLMDAGERVGPGRLPEMLYAIGMEHLLDDREEGPGGEAERVAAEREEARARGDYDAADRKRHELAEMGFEVRDTPEGPQLVRRS
jgi:cysteinyl-tRNA synthetase